MAGARPHPDLDSDHGRAVRRDLGVVLRGASLERRGRWRRVRNGRRKPGERVALRDAHLVLGAAHAVVVDPAQPLDRPGAELRAAVRNADGQRDGRLRVPWAVAGTVLGNDTHDRRPVLVGVAQLTGWQSVLLLPAGLVAGLTGSVAGLASLVSYPALLAVGLGPVNANVTNTVALVFSSVGSVTASGPELRGQRAQVVRVAAMSVLGGLAGGLLLLSTPSDAFVRLVPWLIGLGSLAILLPRRTVVGRPQTHPAVVLPAVLAISLYGGYFGAAAGVLMLALFLRVTHEPLPRANALKNVVLGAANLVAAVLFAIVADVDWVAVLPLAAGFLMGGRLGPVVVRRAPAAVLRPVIALVGLGLAVCLAVRAYR